MHGNSLFKEILEDSMKITIFIATGKQRKGTLHSLSLLFLEVILVLSW